MNHYLNGKELRQEIWLSKLSYCSYIDPLPDRVLACDFDYSGTEEPELMAGLVRIFAYDHIPASDGKRKPRATAPDFVALQFRPFKIYLDGTEIVRSHWEGGFSNGCFNRSHGNLTYRLARAISTLVEQYARRPNWNGYSYIADMRGAALVALTNGILLFDDYRGDNAFAYATRAAENAFIKVWREERKSQDLRNTLLRSAGVNGSIMAEPVAVHEARQARSGEGQSLRGADGTFNLSDAAMALLNARLNPTPK